MVHTTPRSPLLQRLLIASGFSLGLIAVSAHAQSAGLISLQELFSKDGAAFLSDLTGQNAINPNQEVTVRLAYDNRATGAGQGASITTVLPPNFTLVAGTTRNCITPSATETVCNTDAGQGGAIQENAVWNGNNLTISPTAGLYDVPGNQTSGTLEMGKKRYLHLDSCSARLNNAYNENMFLIREAGNTLFTGLPDCGSTFDLRNSSFAAYNAGSRISVDLLGKKYVEMTSCSARLSSGGQESPVNQNLYATLSAKNTAGSVSADCAATFDLRNSALAAYNNGTNGTISLSGGRYLNQVGCSARIFNRFNQNMFTIANPGTTASPNGGGTCADMFDLRNAPGTAFNTANGSSYAVDLLDATRGKGYIEFRMRAPQATGMYSNTASLGGGTVVTVQDGGQIEIKSSGTSSSSSSSSSNSSSSSSSNSSSNTSNTALVQCNDGIDNDGDGAADASDFSCSGPTDNDETNPKAACQDGYDNDGDGRIDYPQDGGCQTLQDNDEYGPIGTSSSSSSANGNCTDAYDNDSDGLIDANDPDCHSDGNPGNSNSFDRTRSETTNNGGNCRDARDNDGDSLIDANDADCHSDGNPSNANSYDGNRNEVYNNGGNCRDARDNDNDSLIDAQDPDCHSDANPSNTASYDGNRSETTANIGNCADGRDNDNDGRIDAQDENCHGDGNVNNANSYDRSRTETGGSSSSSSSYSSNNSGFKLTKEASASEVFPGGSVEYTITIENDTDHDIMDLVVSDRFDAQQMTVTDDGDADQQNNGELRWNVGTIRRGDDETIRYRLRVRAGLNAGRTIRNDAEVRGSGGARDDDSVSVSVIGTLPQTGFNVAGNGGSKFLRPISGATHGGVPFTLWAIAGTAMVGTAGFFGRKLLV
jgi:uncharacterized repeat protein (TIGR01451 family)